MNRLFSTLLLLLMSAALSACSALGGKHESYAVYSPTLEMPSRTDAGTVNWQLLVDTPRSSNALDSVNIAVMPSPGLLEIYPAARWSDPAPTLLRNLIVQAFDKDGRIAGVSAMDAGLSGDFALGIDLHDFQIELQGDGTAQASIHITAKLYDRNSNRIVSTQTFSANAPADSSNVGSAVSAFEAAINQLLPQLVDWTITQGNRHWQPAMSTERSPDAAQRNPGQ